MEPLDQPTRLVRVVALGQVAADRERLTRIEVERDAHQRRGSGRRLLLEERDAAVVIDLHLVVLGHFSDVTDVTDGEQGRAPSARTPGLEDVRREQVVPGHDDDVVVDAEELSTKPVSPIAPGGLPPSTCRRSRPSRCLSPTLEVRRELGVGDDDRLVDVAHREHPLEDAVEQRAAADLEQRLRSLECQRKVEARRVAGCLGTIAFTPAPPRRSSCCTAPGGRPPRSRSRRSGRPV